MKTLSRKLIDLLFQAIDTTSTYAPDANIAAIEKQLTSKESLYINAFFTWLDTNKFTFGENINAVYATFSESLDFKGVEDGEIYLPIKQPTIQVINSLQTVLAKHGSAKIDDEPEGFFAFKGALEHANHSLRLLKGMKEKGLLKTDDVISTEQEDLIIAQLETLVKTEWL
jgi:hypothetical protein